MIIEREQYVNELLAKRWNGKIKIITGIRRCGKSFLLSTLYKNHLLKEGVPEDAFVEIALDRKSDVAFRNPETLFEHVVGRTSNLDKKYYVFIDEIQLSYKIKNSEIDERLVPEEDRDLLYTTFYDILNDLAARPNLDVYVTGSNSKMLSKTSLPTSATEAPKSRCSLCHSKSFIPFRAWKKPMPWSNTSPSEACRWRCSNPRKRENEPISPVCSKRFTSRT